MVKITYDERADAAYIFLTDPGAEIGKTYLCDPKEINGMINLDFGKDGKLVGVEIMDASKKLPKDILDFATRIDQ